ncbi:MAG: cobalamin-dependent protein, partial [Armatimonadota bacterium]
MSDQDHATRGGPKIKACLVTLYLSESLGGRQIASVLKANGHQCSLIFFKEFRWGEFRRITSREEDLLFGLLGDIRPDLVGLSLTSSLVADVALDLSAKIRRRLDVPVILGGAHPSVAPEESLEHADIVCVGEGEEAIADLADALAGGRAYEDIPNLWTKVNGKIHRNDVRPLSDDLDSLPFVSYGDPDSH